MLLGSSSSLVFCRFALMFPTRENGTRVVREGIGAGWGSADERRKLTTVGKGEGQGRGSYLSSCFGGDLASNRGKLSLGKCDPPILSVNYVSLLLFDNISRRTYAKCTW